MAESFLSPVWYRVGSLRPALAPRAAVSRHRYRGRGWYVIYDPATARVHRFTPAAWLIIGRLNGRDTIEAIWDRVVDELGDDAPTQNEVVRLLSQLHSADLLSADVPPDTEEMLERHDKQVRQRLKQQFLNPMAMRLPLVDPDGFLDRTSAWGRLVFSRFGAVVWFLVVLGALIVTALRWPELTENVRDRVLAAENLLLLWIAYPIVKGLHELGHGYAAKLRGVPVHEMGVMFLIFFPVPYVDASASAALPDKRQRAMIAAAGIIVELFVAAVAVIAWALLEPGFLRGLAFNVMLIGGVSTLLLNGNPLLRFDGYYVLTDLIEMPNLAGRSAQFWGRLAEKHLFGATPEPFPLADWRERLWLLVYGPASFAYKIVLTITIALIVGQVAFGLGLLLAVFGLFMSLVLPVFKALRHVLTHQRLAENRHRAVSVTGLGIAALAALLFAAPAPMWTTAEGVVWLAERAHVRAGTDGFVTQIVAAPGSLVTAGQPLIEAAEPAVDTRIEIAAARVDRLERAVRAEQVRNLVQARILTEELQERRAELDRERLDRERLLIRAGSDGRFIALRAADLPGRFVRRGEVLGYVVEDALRTVRVVVAQDAIELVRNRLRGVEVLLVSAGGKRLPADVVREVPAGGFELPAPALSTEGGGRIAIDPSAPGGLATFERIFQLDLVVPEDLPAGALGSRVMVRFDHDWMPVGLQIYRSLRLLVLSELDV